MNWSSELLLMALLLLIAGFGPFLLLELNFGDSNNNSRGLECNLTANVTMANSLVSTYESFNLDNSTALFVHFTAHNLSLQPSVSDSTNTLIDPLNLVWVENTEVPFLSLDLGFNYYSLGLLSRKVYHMTVMIDEDARVSMWNTSYSCATKSLATAFIRQVTKGKGAVCYISEDLKYRCCKDNDSGQTHSINCNVPASVSSEMIVIFLYMAVVALITLFCFPVLFVYLPKIDSFESLTSSTQISINPVYRIILKLFQNFDRCFSKRRADEIRHIFVGIVIVPLLFYVSILINWAIAKHEIQKMFNSAVKETWYAYSNILPLSFLRVIVFINIVAIILCIILSHHIVVRSDNLDIFVQSLIEKLTKFDAKEKHFKINWMTPFIKLKEFLCVTRCKCSVFYVLSLFSKIVISPLILLWNILTYAVTILPVMRIMVLPFFYRSFLLSCLFGRKLTRFGMITRTIVVLVLLVLWIYASLGITFGFGLIIANSLLLISRIIVYTYMGLVANKDDILPKLTLFSIVVFYIWDNSKSARKEYKKLLKQTFENCKQQKELTKQVQETCKRLHEHLRQSAEICKHNHELLKQAFVQSKQHHEFLKKTIEKFEQQLKFLEQVFEERCQHLQFLKQILKSECSLQQKVLEEIFEKSKQEKDLLMQSLEMISQQEEVLKQMLELNYDNDQQKRLERTLENCVQQKKRVEQMTESCFTEQHHSLQQCLEHCKEQQQKLCRQPNEPSEGQLHDILLQAVENTKLIIDLLNQVLQQSQIEGMPNEERPNKILQNLKQRLKLVEQAMELFDGIGEHEGFPELTLANYNEQHQLLLQIVELSLTWRRKKKITKKISELAEKKERLVNLCDKNTKQETYILDQIHGNSLQQVLINEMSEKCEQHQASLANIIDNPPLQFDEKGVPTLSTELFQKVVDEILPLSEVYTKLFVKILLLSLFVLITYNAILIYGRSKLNDTTQALAIFSGSIVLKLFYGDNSEELHDIENIYRIEHIFKEFIITRKTQKETHANQTRTNDDEDVTSGPQSQNLQNYGSINNDDLAVRGDNAIETAPLQSFVV